MTEDTLRPLAAQLASCQAAKAELEAEERQLKQQIRELVEGPDAYKAGDLTVTVSLNRRFDPQLAERNVPTELLDLCKISKVDPAAAKEVLPPALYQACMAEIGDYRVAVK